MSCSCPGHPCEHTASLVVSNDDLVSVRDVMRELPRMVRELGSGKREQFVVLRKGKMVARLIPVIRCSG